MHACILLYFFIGRVVVLLGAVELCDLRHLIVCQSEVENVAVIPDVIGIFRSWDRDELHLCCPAQYDLCAALSVLIGEL